MAITTLTFRLRKNGANTTSVISLASGQTGQFEDATHSDTFVATDEINYSGVTGGTSGTITINHMGVLVANTESASAIKTVDGLAKASVKTVNDTAIGSVKTWAGLA